MAAFEDFRFFQNSAPRPAGAAGALVAEAASRPRRDALRAELERLHTELEQMRVSLERRDRRRDGWRERLLRLVRRTLLPSRPSRRMREGA
jgi:hypothetical protein